MNLRTVFAFGLLVAAGPVLADKPSPDAVIVPAGKNSGARLEIGADDKHIYITAGADELVGETSHAVRYYRKGGVGEALFQMKNDVDNHGFKVEDPAGKLVWKVKFADDKIKIADNEQMSGAWSIKLHADHDKVLDPKDAEIGEVKMNKDSGKIKIKEHDKDRFVVETGHFSSGYGVLLMKSIPEQQRNILAAELLMHGK